MANELHAHATSGKTLYAVLLSSTGQLWNGSAFETYNGANWTTYDFALTEAGAGIYLANMPAAAAGVYSYAVYEQAGASPATTDTLRGTGSILWDGDSEVIPVVTDAIGYVKVSGTKNTLDDLNDAAAAPSAADIKTALEADGSKLDHLWEMTEDDGGVRRLTANALEEAPVDGAAPTVGDIADAVWDEALAGHAGTVGSTAEQLAAAGAADDPWTTALPGAYAAGSAGDIIGNLVTDIGALTPAVAISATTAASVSTGALAVRTYHSLSQAISSTYAGNLAAATKLWLAIKSEKDDTDAQSVIFIEKAAGLTVLAGAAYTTVAHGSLTIGGLAGAWTVTVALDEVATGLLTPYADGMLWAECKALVAGSTVAVWDGVCDVSRGIVNAVA